MTQLHKLAWLNLAFLPLLVVVLVLGELGTLSHTAEVTLLGLILAAATGAMIFMARMPWHKKAVEDERDRLFRQRSFAAAYFVLMGCLPVGLVISMIAFPGGQVPLRFAAGWIGIAFVTSVLGQSVAVLVQYRRGIRYNL